MSHYKYVGNVDHARDGLAEVQPHQAIAILTLRDPDRIELLASARAALYGWEAELDPQSEPDEHLVCPPCQDKHDLEQHTEVGAMLVERLEKLEDSVNRRCRECQRPTWRARGYQFCGECAAKITKGDSI